MKNNKCYVVSSYGGQCEDKWEHVECVFTNEESAREYIKEMEWKMRKISNEEFDKITRFINDMYNNIYFKYFDENTGKPLVDGAEQLMCDEQDLFEDKTKYEIIESEFGYRKDEWLSMEDMMIYDLSGYNLRKVDLIEK